MEKNVNSLLKDTIGVELDYKKIYICHVDDYIGSLNPETGDIDYEHFSNFTEFVTELLHKYPHLSPHNVTDSDIINKVRQKIQLDTIINSRKKNETRC